MTAAPRLVDRRGVHVGWERASRRLVEEARSRRGPLDAEVAVFSFVGVLGITLVLFLVVALTGRLILGR